MPDYRKLWNSAGLSEKVGKLSDFYFRVWIQMRASADDFGVGPMIPGKLQGDNRRLAKATVREVERAMDDVCAAGLFQRFQHQGQAYYFQPDWQDREGITYPRRSLHPYPPADRITTKTRELIASAEESFAKKQQEATEKKARKKKFQKNSENLFETFSENSENFLSQSDHSERGAVQLLTLTPNSTTPNPQPIEEESARETTSPRTLPSAAGPKPLDWWRKHASVHVEEFCDWTCFPVELRDEFTRKLTGVPFELACEQVLVWARRVRAEWTAAGRTVPDGSCWEFWRHRWTEAHGGSKPSTSASFDPLAGVKEVLSRG